MARTPQNSRLSRFLRSAFVDDVKLFLVLAAAAAAFVVIDYIARSGA